MAIVHESQLDAGQVIHEFKHALAGLAALVDDLHKSDDLDGLRLLRSEIDQLHVDLYAAATPVDSSLYWLERRRRQFNGVSSGPGGDGWWEG